MNNMARIDDYINAKTLAVGTLAQVPLYKILQTSGFESADDSTIRVPFLDRVYKIGYPDFGFVDKSAEKKEAPIQEQVLILHYLMALSGRDVMGKWIAYREIPGASFYYSVFVKRAIDPLKKVFGMNLTGLAKAANRLNGVAIQAGDAGYKFSIFPKVPLQLVLWESDDEFPSEANILFDKIIGELLSPEDVAWLAGMVVYRLIVLAH
jgi:hypothetical protein